MDDFVKGVIGVCAVILVTVFSIWLVIADVTDRQNRSTERQQIRCLHSSKPVQCSPNLVLVNGK